MGKILKCALIFGLIVSIGLIICLIFKDSDIKTYSDDNITFDYNSNYRMHKHDDYIELLSENSNITIEVRKLNNIEANSFSTIIDNIVYSYLNTYSDYKLVSRYDSYLLNDKEVARLIFFNEKEKVNSLVLVNVFELNLITVVMNSNDNEFELLMDSAELVMNSLKLESKIRYVSVKTEYPKETFKLIETSNPKMEYNATKTYDSGRIFKDNAYYFNLIVPSDYEIEEDADYHIDLKKGNTTIRYTVISSISDNECYYGECKVSSGYKKYGDKYYYLTQAVTSSNGSTTNRLSIYDMIDYTHYVWIQVSTKNQNIDDEIIEKLIDYKIETKNGHSKINGDYIEGVIDDGYNKYKLKYKIPIKYNVKIDSTTSIAVYEDYKLLFNFNFWGNSYASLKISDDYVLVSDNIKVGSLVYSKYKEITAGGYYINIIYVVKLDDEDSFGISFMYLTEEEFNSLNFEKEILPYFVIEKL